MGNETRGISSLNDWGPAPAKHARNNSENSDQSLGGVSTSLSSPGGLGVE